MVENANEARQRTAIVKGANLLVNETAATPLIAAAEQGEMSAAVPTARFELVPAAGLMGHIYDTGLADALDTAGHLAAALGVRKLVMLGFSVATTVREVDLPEEPGPDAKRTIYVEGLRLGYATAEEIDPKRLAIPLLLGVVLPPAHHWRRRATASQTVRKVEKQVLGLIEVEIERGASRCRIDARKLVEGALPPEIAERLIATLRARGFEAQVGSGGMQLTVRWEG